LLATRFSSATFPARGRADLASLAGCDGTPDRGVDDGVQSPALLGAAIPLLVDRRWQRRLGACLARTCGESACPDPMHTPSPGWPWWRPGAQSAICRRSLAANIQSPG